MDIEVKNFHPLEVKLLRHVALGEVWVMFTSLYFL